MRRSSFVALLVVGALMIPLGVFASHQFNDVPDSHTFHNAIDWMADNGITLGCNPPANTNYCPQDNVTRGQMAAFMKRLAENNVVDAATVDGLDSSQLQPALAASTGSHAHGTGLGSVAAGASFEATSVDIDAPASGVVTLLGSSGWEGGTLWVVQWLEIDEATPCDNWNSTDRLSGSGTEEGVNSQGGALNAQSLVQVPAGTHTVSLCLWPFSGTASLNVDFSLIAEWQAVSSVSIAGDLAGSSDQSAPDGGPSSN
jgi:hypothetical protein